MRAFSKIEQLRARTDEQLVTVILHAIERGMRLPHTPAAQQAFTEACRLLPLLDDLGERMRLDTKLEELRAVLPTRPWARAAGE